MSTFLRGTAMESSRDDQLKTIFELGDEKNVFVIPDDDDDDGLTGELASLDSSSNSLHQELTMSDLRFEDCHASNVSKAYTMEHPAALIEEEDDLCSSWKPISATDQDNWVASETPSTTKFFAQTVQDVQNFEDGLMAQGMERSEARQMAMSMKNSQVLIESQRQLEHQRMMMECRQRQLDREWARRQHEERLRAEAFHRNVDRVLAQQRHEEAKQASRFDPNWQEKLQMKRDKCFSTIANVGWKATGIHYGSMFIFKPIVDSFYSQSHYLPYQEFGRWASNLICDCESSTDSYLLSSYIGLDSGLCYSSCVASVGLKVAVAILANYSLRVFSAPTFMHHMLNLMALPCVLGISINTMLIQRFTMEALLSFTWIYSLVIGLVLAYGLAYWKHRVCKARVQEASKSPIDFPEAFEKSMQQLDHLHAQLWLGQGVVIALFCYNVWQLIPN